MRMDVRMAEFDTCASHFTGKERDAESGNDYFLARYYNSATGRFLSPDWSAKVEPVPYAKLGAPQSLNLYAYVLNNPLNKVDPDGHCRRAPGDPPCDKVKVSATVQEKPTLQQNVPLPDGRIVTGEGGKITERVTTTDGKPLPNVQVTEQNKVQLTVDGKDVSTEVVNGKKPSTDNQGRITDTFGQFFLTGGSSQANSAVVNMLETKPVTKTGTQTLTLTMPGGETCSADITRVLTNVGPGGTVSPAYTINPGGPSVARPTPPTQ